VLLEAERSAPKNGNHLVGAITEEKTAIKW